ncbi:U1 zinc finger-domain-containing protein [Endogone sp. FLAS-F59071]|nr:U1 zinc finger-domain-containing protein [Endogone sp. FLAS-F59071]|eukprot:RUS15202.1 U1 zinc finger-domain-containing protein [Endogone sp. FLAS-F59071]
MPKYYCEYCDIYLTHDSASVRKAHNAGKNHLLNVRTYYAELGQDKAQALIDQVTGPYENLEENGLSHQYGFNNGMPLTAPYPPDSSDAFSIRCQALPGDGPNNNASLSISISIYASFCCCFLEYGHGSRAVTTTPIRPAIYSPWSINWNRLGCIAVCFPRAIVTSSTSTTARLGAIYEANGCTGLGNAPLK